MITAVTVANVVFKGIAAVAFLFGVVKYSLDLQMVYLPGMAVATVISAGWFLLAIATDRQLSGYKNKTAGVSI